MSGGTFNYKQYTLEDIAETLEHEIALYGESYSEETLSTFYETLYLLKKTKIYVHRIDWLLASDDGEDTFKERLQKELESLDKEWSKKHTKE